jgi:myosin-5
MLPKGTDEKFAARLYKALHGNPRFLASKTEQMRGQFVILHYTGHVRYNVQNFCDKNKDELPKESQNLFLTSPSPLIPKMFRINESIPPISQKKTVPSNDNKKGGALSRSFVGTQFKSQLSELMKKIQTTRPHYIRCLKPNDENVADKFKRIRVTEQLRYGGVLEAVRVARSGYPVRLPHDQWYQRYRILMTMGRPGTICVSDKYGRATIEVARNLIAEKPPMKVSSLKSPKQKEWCEKLLDALATAYENELDPNDIQLGITKVFLRKGCI